jgi:histidine ammonia-lyase
MLGIGEAAVAGETHAGRCRARRAGLVPLVLGPKEGLALLNGTQFLHREPWRACSPSNGCSKPRSSRARCTDAAKGSDTPFDRAHSCAARPRGQIEVAAALRALMAGSRSAPRTSSTTTACRTLLPALPAAGDGAVLDLVRRQRRR